MVGARKFRFFFLLWAINKQHHCWHQSEALTKLHTTVLNICWCHKVNEAFQYMTELAIWTKQKLVDCKEVLHIWGKCICLCVVPPVVQFLHAVSGYIYSFIDWHILNEKTKCDGQTWFLSWIKAQVGYNYMNQCFNDPRKAYASWQCKFICLLT